MRKETMNRMTLTCMGPSKALYPTLYCNFVCCVLKHPDPQVNKLQIPQNLGPPLVGWELAVDELEAPAVSVGDMAQNPLGPDV